MAATTIICTRKTKSAARKYLEMCRKNATEGWAYDLVQAEQSWQVVAIRCLNSMKSN